MLRPAGYATCHIGKWHLGDDAWFPPAQGFDENYGGCDIGQPPSYFDPYYHPKYAIPTLKPRKEGEFLTDREGDEAVGFITRNKDKPFFLYLANYAVHTPIQAKPEVAAGYKQPGKKDIHAKYAALVESVDDATGKVLAALDELKLAENTLVIFTSDNGGLDNGDAPTDNAPLRSGKGYPFEGGIRVPLIVRWTGTVPAGKTSDTPAISMDLMPTIAEAVGVKTPADREMDGRSLLSHVKSGGEEELKRRPLFWHFPHYRHAPGPYSIVRQGNWKMIKYYEGPSYLLFNLRKDLSEAHDLAGDMPDKVQQLDKLLAKHIEDVGSKVPRPNPDYKPKPTKGK
jgi:arylsulfatase A-like enzyme